MKEGVVSYLQEGRHVLKYFECDEFRILFSDGDYCIGKRGDKLPLPPGNLPLELPESPHLMDVEGFDYKAKPDPPVMDEEIKNQSKSD